MVIIIYFSIVITVHIVFYLFHFKFFRFIFILFKFVVYRIKFVLNFKITPEHFSYFLKTILITLTCVFFSIILRKIFDYNYIITILIVIIARLYIKNFLNEIIIINSSKQDILPIIKFNIIPIVVLYSDNKLDSKVKILYLKLFLINYNYSELYYSELIAFSSIINVNKNSNKKNN